MSDYEEINSHLSRISTIVDQQAALITTMAEQQRVLFTLNTIFLRLMKGQIDIELVRARALEVFPDPERDANAVAIVHAMLGPVRTQKTPPSAEEERNHLRDVARARFRLIEGGSQSGEGAK